MGPSPGWRGWNHTRLGCAAASGVLPPLPGDVSRQACYLGKQRIRITGRATSCIPGARPGSAQLESHPDSHSEVLVAGPVVLEVGRKTSVVSSVLMA